MSKMETKNIVVVATMSAGKSTLINALMGKELLASANQATTAKIIRIHQKQHARFAVAGYDKNGELMYGLPYVHADTLKDWNLLEELCSIDVYGALSTRDFKSASRDIVIYDTPGPNNSQDQSHQNLMEMALVDSCSELIVYVLNSGYIGAKDDRKLLSEINQHLKKNTEQRIIFVLNKVDVLDEEAGEDLSKCINDVKQYLMNSGFENPVIVPAMLEHAMTARAVIDQKCISRKQKLSLKFEIDRFRENKCWLNNNALIPAPIKMSIENYLKIIILPMGGDNSSVEFSYGELDQFIAYSGIKTIENLLINY